MTHIKIVPDTRVGDLVYTSSDLVAIITRLVPVSDHYSEASESVGIRLFGEQHVVRTFPVQRVSKRNWTSARWHGLLAR